MRYRAHFKISKFTTLHNSFKQETPAIDVSATSWEDVENGAMKMMMKVVIANGWVLRSIELLQIQSLNETGQPFRVYSKLVI